MPEKPSQLYAFAIIVLTIVALALLVNKAHNDGQSKQDPPPTQPTLLSYLHDPADYPLADDNATEIVAQLVARKKASLAATWRTTEPKQAAARTASLQVNVTRLKIVVDDQPRLHYDVSFDTDDYSDGPYRERCDVYLRRGRWYLR